MRPWIPKALIFSLLMAASAQGDTPTKFDSSVFKTANPMPEKTPVAGSKPAKSSFKPQTPELADENLALEKIRAVNTLLSKEVNADRRRKLLFNKGILYLQYARILRLKSKNASIISPEEQNALKNTVIDMDEIIKDRKVSKRDKSYAFYISGMSYSSAGQDDKAIGFMSKSIETFPAAPYAVGVSLFLGEYYFDHEKYQLAIDYYKKFYTRMGPKEKALAKYKTAWCFWNLHDLEKTQTFFVELAKDKNAGEFGVDANKDLAYVMTQYKSDAEILTYSEEIFGKDDKKRLIFLTSAYVTLRRQKHTDAIQKIFQTLLQLEKVPSKKVALWLDEISNNKFDYASAIQYTLFEKMRAMFLAMSPSEREEVTKNVGEQMENEIQSLVRSFIDTYSGRIKNIEKIDKVKLAQALEKLFVFHDTYFPKSKVRLAINQLWLEVCIDQKDLKCVYDISNKIISDPQLEPIHERANTELLAAVDELFRQDEGKYRSDYVTILEKYIKNPKAPRWLEAAKRLSAIDLKVKDYSKAIPILQAINDREKSKESFYRLQLGRFDAQKYQDVVDAKPPSGVEAGEKTIDLTREASLKLAIENEKDPAKFAAYEVNIERYLSLNSNQENSIIVLRDYLNHLIDRKDFQKATERLLRANHTLREGAELKPIAILLAAHALKFGQFESAGSLLAFKKNQTEFTYERFTAKIGEGGDVDIEALDNFEPDKITYLLGVLTLTQPKIVIEYIRSKKTLTPDLKKIGVLALQINEGEKYVDAPRDLKKLLGRSLPVKEDIGTPLVSEKMIANTKIPEKADGSQESAQVLEKLMKRARKIRHEVIWEIKGKPQVVQVRVLTAEKKLEQGIGDLILNSAVPENLNATQVVEYKKGLQELAKEFVDQAADFDKSIQTISSQVTQVQKVQEDETMPAFNGDHWNWPHDDASKAVFELVKKGRFTGAILSLDLLRTSHEIAEIDFLRMRVGVLMTAHNNQVMASYLRRELLDSKTDGQTIIDEWKKLK